MRPHLTPRSRIALGLAVALAGGATALAVNAQASQDTPAAGALASGQSAPYLYLGWGNPPNATDYLKASGVKQVTLAFINADNGCNPAWDGSRPLKGGSDEKTIKAIQAAGGDVTPSIGGADGNKLGQACGSAQDLAGAYQKVIDAYGLKSIDIDIESAEFQDGATRQKVIDALKTVKDKNKGLKEYVTFPTTPQGPEDNGKDLISKGAKAGLDVDGWTVMPFDFGDGTSDMVGATKSSVDGLASTVASAYGISKDEAYKKVGFSSMNGKTDADGESVSPDDFQKMVDYATQHHLARVSFWAVNRDHNCSNGGDPGDSCSGIDQSDWQFSKINAGYGG